jgi:hypothetical protein
MTIGFVLLILGAIQTVWMIWRIRKYDPNRVSVLETALHDIARTQMRPKTRLGILIERSSYWCGLLMGLVLMGLGLIFANME